MQQKSELQTNDKIQGQVEYPHNLLRNIAKESALTEYVLGKFYNYGPVRSNVRMSLAAQPELLRGSQVQNR